MTDTLRFDAGASGNPYVEADTDPDLTADSSTYFSFKVISAPVDFAERTLYAIGTGLILFGYIGNLRVHDSTGTQIHETTGITSYGWIHACLRTSSGVTTLSLLEEGFNAGAPSYLYNSTCSANTGNSVISARDFGFGFFQGSDACHQYGNYIHYDGTVHTDAEMLAQFASRSAVHASPFTELHFDDAANPGVDQSGNANDWTGTNVDGLVEVADEPSEWAGAGTTDGVGASSATVAVSGVGSSVAAATGASSITLTVSGVGSSVAASAGANSVSVTAAAGGSALMPSSGASTLSVTATGAGSSIAASVGSAAASVTDAAVGSSVASGAGASSVTVTASAEGQTLADGTAVGASVISVTTAGVGASTAAATGASSLSVTATAVGGSVFAAVGESNVSITAAADGSTGSTIASAVGTSAISVTGSATASSVAAGAGVSTITVSASGIGASVAASIGASSFRVTATATTGALLPATKPSVSEWIKQLGPSAIWLGPPAGRPTATAWTKVA